MRRLLAVGLVVALLVGTVPVTSVSGTPTARDATAAPKTLGAAEDFDSVEFHVTVYENGTAEWTFMYQRTLNNESERQQFHRFANEFNNNSTKLYTQFKAQAQRLTSAGQNVTGRAMKAESFSKNAEVGGLVNNNRGIVQMSFQWTGFASADGDTLVIGDVFEGGLYIGPNQSMVVHSGPQLRFQSVSPNVSSMAGDDLASSESVTWQGERDFTDRRPRVKFEPVKTTPTVTTETGDANETTPGNASQPPANGGSPLFLFVAAVVVLLGLAAAFAWRQGDFGSLGGTSDNPGSGGAGGAGAAAVQQRDDPAPEPSVSDEELLTDEARVKKLLDENGGRMKQVNIVDETGWSKSKVSMLLSEMEEEGDISKLRVGRENIISLEGHEPDAAGSPLEGE
ncbi:MULTISPECIES: helix-turn-helix transcriptional regulator [Halorussus]|uniref:helix-turn-helix transcriptional regulator n=1 Tax=Halorussus TaxID=1070314 RepID=UPI0020A13C39|nr:hypothetical protein [Halorussus vallis]USZ75980.1 hypothetical protein NGM07_01340 [Halorussus vallis]